MAGIQLPGIATGLDTSTLIDQLMQAEAVPQTLLKNRLSSEQSYLSALQNINALVASLDTTASAMAEPGGLAAFTAKSSVDGVSATAGASAVSGSYSFRVDQIATAKTIVTQPMTTFTSSADGSVSLTLDRADGTSTVITSASADPASVAAAINKAQAGITASAVAVGTDSASGSTLYRLQIVSARTGEAGDFTLSTGTAAGGDLNDLMSQGAVLVQAAQDARLTLWAGTSAEQQLSSGSNTFDSAIAGVSLTVSQAAVGQNATLTVSPDQATVQSKASELVNAVAKILSTIASQSAVSTTTGSDGTSSTSGGVFTADSTITALRNALSQAAGYPVDGESPSTIGVSIASDGTLSLDADAFAAAYAADPDKTTAMLQTISDRVSQVAAQYSDKYSGLITGRITSENSIITDLGDQISDWDDRLAQRRAQLEQVYASLEVTINNMNAQQSWLQSQLGGLPSYSSGSSA